MAVSYWPYIAPFVGEEAGENKCIVIRTYTMRHSADALVVSVHPENRVARCYLETGILFSVFVSV